MVFTIYAMTQQFSPPPTLWVVCGLRVLVLLFVGSAVEDPDLTAQLKTKWNLDDGPLIGFAARFAAEKGVEVLLEALPLVIREFPGVRVAFTGACRDTIGNSRPAGAAQRNRESFVRLAGLVTDHFNRNRCRRISGRNS